MKNLLTIILFILLPLSLQPQSVTGTVYDSPFIFPLNNVMVTVKDNASGQLLGTDTTDINGSYNIEYTISSVTGNTIPAEFSLSQAYPNPFNPSTRIDFTLPAEGNYSVTVYNILGQLLYSKSFLIQPGSYSFNISGLPGAGVYLFNISGDDFTQTRKLILLDGGSGNIKVTLSGSSSLKKTLIDDLLIEFRREGYFDKDTLLSWSMHLTVDAEITQVPRTAAASYAGTVELNIGGSGAGLNVEIENTANDSTLVQTITDSLGEWNAGFNYQYQTNGVDTLYNLDGVRINITGSNIQPLTKEIIPFTPSYFWDAVATVLQQQTNATYNIHVQNEQTGENVPNANVVVKDENQNDLFTIVTNASGNATKTYPVNFSVSGNDTTWQYAQLNTSVSKGNYENLNFAKPFKRVTNEDTLLTKIPYVVNFSLNPWNISGFTVNDPEMKTISQDSTRTHTVDVDGKIHFNYSLFNDVVEKNIKLVQTNSDYNPYLTIIGLNQTPDQLNPFENNISGPQNYQNVPDTLVINLDVMNAEGNANLILEPSHVYHPAWGYVGTMSDTLRSFIGEYPGIDETTRWSTTGVNDSTVKIFNWSFEEISGDPVPADQLAQTEAILDTILSKTVHPSGKVLFQYDRYLIDSLQDPNWVNATQQPISNLVYTRHKNQTSGNLLTIHPENNFARYGNSRYAVGISAGQKASEILSSFTGMDDNIYGTPIGIAFDQSNLSLTDLGLYLIYKNWMSNPGRRVK